MSQYLGFLFTFYFVCLRDRVGVSKDVCTRFVDQTTTCEAWFSPSTVWVLRLNSGLRAWWQKPLPTLPFHWPLIRVNKEKTIQKTILKLMDSIKYLSKTRAQLNY